MCDYDFDFDRAVALVGTLANVAMAIAAVAAFSAWRKQIQGATEHKLATALSGTLYRLASARDRMVRDLRTLDGRTPLASAMMRLVLPERIGDAAAIVAEIKSLETQAKVVWGAEVGSAVSALHSCTGDLVEFVRALVGNDLGGQVVFAQREGTPTFKGEAFTLRANRLDALLQSWLGKFVGRSEGISLQQFVEQRKAIEATTNALAKEEWDIGRDEADEQQADNHALYDEILAAEKAVRERFDQIGLQPTSPDAESGGPKVADTPTGEPKEPA